MRTPELKRATPNTQAATAEISRIMAEFFADAAAQRGDPRVFNLKRGQSMYRYVGTVGRTRYCYTPHADTNGDYWAFDEVVRYRNRRAKVGELIERSERTRWVRCAKRSTAIKRAQRRYNTAQVAARKRREIAAA